MASPTSRSTRVGPPDTVPVPDTIEDVLDLVGPPEPSAVRRKTRDLGITGERAPAVVPGATPVSVTIEVMWNDISEAPGDVIAVGHFENVYPTASEAALDRAFSGDAPREERRFHGATARGSLAGGLGDITFYPWRRADGDRHVGLVGLGRPGTFGRTQQGIALRNLLWAAEHLAGATDLSFVMIGGGSGNLDIEETVRNVVDAVDGAVATGDLTGALQTVRIIEYELGRARRVHRTLAAVLQGREREPAQITLGPLQEVQGIVSDETALQRLLAGALRGDRPAIEAGLAAIETNVDLRTEVAEQVVSYIGNDIPDTDFYVRRVRAGRRNEAPTRLSVLVRDGELVVSAVSDTATVAERVTGLDVELFEELIEQASLEARGDPAKAGRMLMNFAVPREFRPFLSQGRSIVLEVDAVTAALQWEVLPVDADQPGPEMSLGRITPLARQLHTTRSRPPTPLVRAGLTRALVIGDPGAGDGTGRLPGAEAEASIVIALLRDRNVEVDVLVGAEDTGTTSPATLQNVLHRLLKGGYDLIHYAGHGSFSATDPTLGSGWILGPRMLQGKHLTMVESLPPLIVANACHSGRVSTGLPGLADEFISHGARNIVGTARAVDDDSAQRFARSFYETLLHRGDAQGALTKGTLGAAVVAGRNELADNALPDWDAYQLYGDPDFSYAD